MVIFVFGYFITVTIYGLADPYQATAVLFSSQSVIARFLRRLPGSSLFHWFMGSQDAYMYASYGS